MKQKIQKHNHDAPEKLDLFRDTFRGKMPLTDDYVFHAVFGRDTAESKGALMEILNIILARKQDPIRAIVIKNPIETPEREMEKGTVMDMTENTYRKVSQDELEYERREARLKYQLQYNTEISVAREQGLAQGLKKAKQPASKKARQPVSKKARQSVSKKAKQLVSKRAQRRKSVRSRRI